MTPEFSTTVMMFILSLEVVIFVFLYLGVNKISKDSEELSHSFSAARVLLRQQLEIINKDVHALKMDILEIKEEKNKIAHDVFVLTNDVTRLKNLVEKKNELKVA